MYLKYCDRIIEDHEYYITKCYKQTDLLKIADDVQKAREELKKIEQMLFDQVNKIPLITEYKQVEISRRKAYKGNVEISVNLYRSMRIEGVEVKKEFVYGPHKLFAGNEKKIAIEYAKELSNKNERCAIIYDNWK